LSETVHQMLGSRFGHVLRDLGSQRVKNISRPIGVWQWSPDPPAREPEAEEEALNQRVQFCMTDDGVQLAYASVGEGTPVFKAPNWLNHLEYEWRSPVWGPMLSAIAAKHRLVRFDQRGNGLSDWEVEEISYGRMIADMARVVEASGLEKFALLGISQGCGLSVRFAAEYPEKVKCLVLYGGYLRGPLTRGSKENQELHDASVAMIRHGWGSPNATYRHFFTEGTATDLHHAGERRAHSGDDRPHRRGGLRSPRPGANAGAPCERRPAGPLRGRPAHGGANPGRPLRDPGGKQSCLAGGLSGL
ncbi:MAG: alpha/beta hydrolase, partial [Limibacillus sp.]